MILNFPTDSPEQKAYTWSDAFSGQLLIESSVNLDWGIGKQCPPRTDAAEGGIWSGSTLFAQIIGKGLNETVLVWQVRPTKIKISLPIRTVWLESSLCSWRTAFLAIQNAPNEDSDQTAQMRSLIWIFVGRTFAQSDLNFRWAHMSEDTFSHVETRLLLDTVINCYRMQAAV